MPMPPILRRLSEWTLRWSASRHAGAALAAVSFTESSVFPIPADVIFVPMVLARPQAAWRLALIATVASVLGGVLGWLIGHYAFEALARPLLELYGKMAAFEALKAQTGGAVILGLLVTSGASHLPPMKVVTILSGVVAFPLHWFILSAIVARGGRFFLLAWALRRYGPAVTGFIERSFTRIALAVLAAAALIFLFLYFR